MKRKTWMKTLLALCLGLGAATLGACSLPTDGDQPNGQPNELQAELAQIYAQYVVYTQAQSETPLSYEAWLDFVKGGSEADIEEIYIDENGRLIVKLIGQETQDLGQIASPKDDGSDDDNDGSNDGGGNDGDGNDGSNDGEDGNDGDGSGNDGNGDGDGTSGGGGDSTAHTYTAFTTTEKALFTEQNFDVLPFLPNDEYYVEAYEYEEESGVNFYTYGNTKAEFNAYLSLFSAYVDAGTYEDDYGDTWYCFDRADYFVDLAWYQDGGENIVDVYVYRLSEDGGDTSGGGGTSTAHTYTAFTASEKALFTEQNFDVLPFLPNDEYYVEAYEYEEESGVNFYTYGNTKAEFNAYLSLFSAYVDAGTYEDDYGDTWYCFDRADYFVDLAWYQDGGENIVDVYVYRLSEGDGNNGSNTGGGSSTGTELLENDGKGLPVGQNGVYGVDLTKATYAKNVTEQGYYLGGCPTTGSPSVLVIPVEFSDVTATDKGYELSTLRKAFCGGENDTDYYSVHDYYYRSSYGQLDLKITVADGWFRPQYTSAYYKSATYDYYGDTIAIGDQLVMNEALQALSKTMDLSDFDSDKNGIIDAVVLITTLDVDPDEDFYWAYRYWNVYTDDEDYYYEYDGVSANDYLWASYGFLWETVDRYGNPSYDDRSAVNTYTYIHEFGHVLGADDYYDTTGIGSPMGGYDVMDAMLGDHNAYTKFHYGWLTASRLVVADESVTLTLEDFSENGDTVILANNWDDALGAYQEYYLLVYYTNDGLNAGEGGYFDGSGILVYHINATLYKEVYEGETYYDVYNTNTHPTDPDGYGTENNLIELVAAVSGNTLYTVGDKLSASTTTDGGEAVAYTFEVVALTETAATLTFTKNG